MLSFFVQNVFHEVDAIFGPSIEQVDDATKAKGNVFLPDSPTKLYKSGKFNHVPWIAGVNSEEGCFRSPRISTIFLQSNNRLFILLHILSIIPRRVKKNSIEILPLFS